MFTMDLDADCQHHCHRSGGDKVPSIALSAIMRRQWLLIDHVLELFPRREPTASIVNSHNLVEFFRAQFVRAFVWAQDTSSVARIVYTAEPINGGLEKARNIILLRHVEGILQDVYIGELRLDDPFSVLKALLVAVCNGDTFAAFFRKGA